jgi:hypothetical protein
MRFVINVAVVAVVAVCGAACSATVEREPLAPLAAAADDEPAAPAPEPAPLAIIDMQPGEAAALTALRGWLAYTGADASDCAAVEGGNYRCADLQIQLWYVRDGAQHAMIMNPLSKVEMYVSWRDGVWLYSPDDRTPVVQLVDGSLTEVL